EKLIVGNGLDDATDIGPVINQKSYDKIVDQLNDAVAKGAEVLVGNKNEANLDKESFFIYPTVLKNVNDKMDIMHEETFGPVAPITRPNVSSCIISILSFTFGPVAPITSFKNLEEAIEIAND